MVGGCSKHTFKLGSYFPSLAHPSRLAHTCWRADGELTYRVSILKVTNSSSPSHKFAGALGSSSSSSLSGHPGPLFDRTVMVVKYPNNQGGTKSPSLCRKAISLLARYERRQIRLGEGNMFLVWSCSSRMFFFSFREACAVRSVCGVLPGMSPKPRDVGPSSPGLESSPQLVASSRNFYLWHTPWGGQGMSWSSLLASYAVPSMVLIQIVCTS